MKAVVMKKILVASIMILFTLSAYAQRPNDEYVTDQDIQIRFPGAQDPTDGDWHSPTVTSITYSEDSLGVHKNKVKLGPQRWEWPLQQNMAIHEKCQADIEILTIPPGFRVMELRVRVRSDTSNGIPVVGPWSDPNNVKVIGKPGNPFMIAQ